MTRAAPIALVIAAALFLVGVWMFVRGGAPAASSSVSLEDDETDLVGGFGTLGGGGTGMGSGVDPDARSTGGHDAGVLALDAGESSTAITPALIGERASAPRELPASMTFPEPRTTEDELESANMVWSMIEARREAARADLAEARRIGDQQLSDRLAHQLELLDIGHHRLERIVRDLESRHVEGATETADTAHESGAEGAGPE